MTHPARFFRMSLSLAALAMLAACAPSGNGTQSREWTPAAGDNRIVLTQQEWSVIRDRLLEADRLRNPAASYPNIDDLVEEEFALSKQLPADTTVRFEDADAGIALDVPYNTRWVNDRYVLPPYEVSDGSGMILGFGPAIYNWHGMYLGRTTILTTDIARTTAEAVEVLKEDEFVDADPVVRTIGSHEVIEYGAEFPEAAPVQVIEIPAGDVNYLLFSTDESMAGLEEIVKSMQISDMSH